MIYTPAQVAQQLGVSVQTLRRWSAAFAGALGESARPAPGRQRSYTADDVLKLREAKRLLGAGRSLADVAAILPTIQPAGEAPPMIPETPGSALVSALTIIADQKANLERLQAEVETLAERLSALEQAANRSPAPSGLLTRIFRKRQ